MLEHHFKDICAVVAPHVIVWVVEKAQLHLEVIHGTKQGPKTKEMDPVVVIKKT